MLDVSDTAIEDQPFTPDAFDLAFDAAATPVDTTEPLIQDEQQADAQESIQSDALVVQEVAQGEPETPVAVEQPSASLPPTQELAPVIPAPEPAQTPVLADESITPEEQTLLDAVAADFPEVMQAIVARERVLIAKMENVFAAKLAEVTSQFAPAVTVAKDIARSRHEEAILSVHNDAFDVRDKVIEWIGTQPSFLKNTYESVLQKGTASEVVELLSVYKKATGAVEAHPAAGPTPEELAQQQQEKTKKLNAQEGVRGRHTGGRATVDPDDFDGAFDKFAATA